MPKYVLAYHGGSMPETEADQAAVMGAWGAWFGVLGDAVVDVGNPTGASKTLKSDGSVTDYLLRLRRAGDTALLTYKGPARFAGGVKTREERETGVSDPEETEAILIALGWTRRFRYEKKREEWTLEGCAVALDQTPIGNFVEVEGDPPGIRRAVVALGLDFADAVPYTYARLYAERRKEDPKLPADMIFQDRKA